MNTLSIRGFCYPILNHHFYEIAVVDGCVESTTRDGGREFEGILRYLNLLR